MRLNCVTASIGYQVSLNYLLYLQADSQVAEFLKEEHTFPEYEKLVLQYKGLVSELQYEVQKVFSKSLPVTSHYVDVYVIMYSETCL